MVRSIEAGAPPPPPANEESIEHGRWFAQRYGTLAFLPEGDPPRLVDIKDGSQELIARLREDTDALRCHAELAHLGHVIRYGSSGDMQPEKAPVHEEPREPRGIEMEM